MNKRLFNASLRTLYALVSAALIFAFSTQGFAQTAAGTDIKNTASATYSDGTTNYSAVSNEVTVTVAKISGIAITPDAGTLSTTVVPGQQDVAFQFTVTNTSNFTDTINFLANNSSATVTGSATIDHIEVGSTTIGSSGHTASVVAGGTLTVTVYVDISTTAAASSTIQVFLGDAASGTNFDNIAYSAATTPHDVYTTATGAVNGQREARGDRSATVANDAVPDVALVGPASVTAGSNIAYTATNCNVGQRDLSNPYLVIALPNEPTPAETTFAGFTGSSTGYNSALSYSANGSTWTAATFATLPSSGVNYIRINLTTNPLLPGGACETVTYNVNVPGNYDATNPVNATVTLFGTNSLGATVSDVSGTGASGTPTVTNVTKVGGPYLGPDGLPQASGPGVGGNTNNDVTEKTAILSPAVAPGTATTSATVVTFTNTLENKGNATDTFTFTAPTVPAGSTVEVSFAGGPFVTVPTSGTTVTSPSVVKDGTLQLQVRVTLPIGTLSGAAYNTVLTATSVNENTKSNSTIDRILLGGFVNLNKSVSCANQCEPGDIITYTVTFSNFSTTLTASSLVITENGSAGTNNWATTTTATGTPGITGVSGASTSYNVGNTILTSSSMSVAPGGSGTLTFQRRIN